MEMTLRLRRGWLLLLLALGGCGPGVGGTGTGEQSYPLEYFGATAASVCTASFAGELKCPSRIVIGPTRVDPTEGSEPVVWIDDPAGTQVTARINLSDIEFEAPCENTRFVGTWGTKAGEATGRFYGYYSDNALNFVVPATLTVLSADGVGLYYLIQDANGRSVFGPRLLQRGNGDGAVAACPQASVNPQSPRDLPGIRTVAEQPSTRASD